MLLSDGEGEKRKENIGRDISNSKGIEDSNIKKDPIEIGFRGMKKIVVAQQQVR
jgi:hypothetical protein